MDSLSIKFSDLFGEAGGVQRFFCPGRVNLIGEHIDYLGGLVMPTAISLGITALIRPNRSNEIQVHSTDFNETVQLDLQSLSNLKGNSWSDFVLGSILTLKKKGVEISGCQILIDSNLPKGSGLSSSAALEVLCYFMFNSVFSQSDIDRVNMAVECQKIENDFIGVNCGIMDQFAVANGKVNHAIVLNCDSLEHEFVPLHLNGFSLVVFNTNKPRALAESAYNQRRRECDEALKLISNLQQISNLVQAKLEYLDLIEDSILKKRARHAITEQIRVEESVAALKSSNLKRFGNLMNASHASLRDDFEVSCSELDFIVDALQNSKFCLGARMTGAGFGGCCIALVKSESVQELSNSVAKAYQSRFGFSPTYYDCKPSNGVHRVS